MFVFPALLAVVALIVESCGDPAAPTGLSVAASPSADVIPRHHIFELSLQHNGAYDNKFLDVAVDVVFMSPSGTRHRVKGFYYGGDVWKVRFRPDEAGKWTYAYSFAGTNGFRDSGGGSFETTRGDAAGPIRPHPSNPYRWIFDSGRPYFPVGIQDCISLQGSRLPSRGIDGEKRGDKNRVVSQEEYFSIYGEAGFNLFRFSQKNCSYTLYEELDNYLEVEGRVTDELLSLARDQGFRVMFGFFGVHGKWTHRNRIRRVAERIVRQTLGIGFEEGVDRPDDGAIVAKEKRFIDYAVSRWGVYVDFWELLNEREASDAWTNLMADYVRSVDPDGKPISTSWEKPHVGAIDINAPHWYELESEYDSDLRVRERASAWKEAGKPVIVGEQGNSGMNWDPRSALRMRIRTWTALFQEIALIFWNTSWSKAGVFQGRPTKGAANIYLGPEERGYIRVLQDFSSRLEADVRMAPARVSSPDRVRVYALLASTQAAAYLHHFEDHDTAVQDLTITLEIPGVKGSTAKLDGVWVEPSTGKALKAVRVAPGLQTLDVPPFAVDLALLVTAADGRTAQSVSLREPGYE